MSARRSCRVILEHYSACPRLASRPLGLPWRRMRRSLWSARWSRRPARRPSSAATTARACSSGRTRSTPPAGCSAAASSCACSTTARRASRNAALYEQLIREEKRRPADRPVRLRGHADRGGEAERARRVMVNGAGPARAVHRRGPRYRVPERRSRMPPTAPALLEIAAEAGHPPALRPRARRRRPRARWPSGAARGRRGFTAGESRSTAPGIADFAAQVAKARAAQAEAWIAFGDVRDAAEMVKTFQRAGLRAARFSSRSGAARSEASSRWSGRTPSSAWARSSSMRASRAGQRAFAKAFAAKWIGAARACRPPRATSPARCSRRRCAAPAALDQEKLRAALAELETRHRARRVPVTPDSGAQIGGAAGGGADPQGPARRAGARRARRAALSALGERTLTSDEQ